MEQQREQVAHSPGPLSMTSGNLIRVMQKGAGVSVAGVHRIGRARGSPEADAKAIANARLLAAAYTSYDKHCGPRAVECAEGDLLGELIGALKALVLCIGERGPDGHHSACRIPATDADRAAAVLAKPLGKAG